MAIDKLNKIFQSKQVLKSEEMNQITTKIDEIIEDELKNVTSDKVTAASLVEQNYLIFTIRNILIKFLNGGVLANSIMAEKLKIGGADFCVIGTSTPSESPDFEGQIYIDKAGKKAYIAAGVDSVSDWKTITN